MIRAYIEIWRGLPIVVTIFLIYFAFPRLDETIPHLSEHRAARRVPGGDRRADPLGERAGRGGDARRRAVDPAEQHEAAAALGFGWVGRHVFVILPQAARRLLPPMVGLLVNIIQNTTIAGLIGVGEVLEVGEPIDRAAALLDRRSHALRLRT